MNSLDLSAQWLQVPPKEQNHARPPYHASRLPRTTGWVGPDNCISHTALWAAREHTFSCRANLLPGGLESAHPATTQGAPA